jgi:hypothetical protein
MKIRIAKLLLPFAAVAALLAALPLAQAGTPNRNHVVNSTIKSNAVETRGDVTIDAGLVTDRRLGEGAAIIRTSSAGGFDLDLKFKVWYGAGLSRGEGTLTFAPQPDGTATFSGRAHYTGGTGKFRGITGQLRVEGTIAADGLATTHVTGNARY